MRVKRPRQPQQLRIIGGTWRGRKLHFPEIETLRPTPDRVRETLFNWLAPVVVGARCLDLYSGSGALGLEALSRGAASVVMVDSDARVITRLREHIHTLQVNSADDVQGRATAKGSTSVGRSRRPASRDIGTSLCGTGGTTPGMEEVESRREQRSRTPGATIVQAEALAYLASTPPQAFDIVFLDPPFRLGLIAPACEALEKHGWLKPGATIYLEAEESHVPQLPVNWRIIKSKKAGQVGYHLARRDER